MLPVDALITSSSAPASGWKLFGQSLLERNIRMLGQAGIKRIFLDLNDADMKFYERAVRKHVQSLRGVEIVTDRSSVGEYIRLEANQFMLFRAFSDSASFTGKKGILVPVVNDEQYRIEDDAAFSRARRLAIEVIRTGSGGKIAQNVNKRISIPLSLVLARLRVLPNVITIVNFFAGAASIVFIALNCQAIGGILVQVCSIVDGCDGEVARMTTRFSKLGGLLDTLSDQMLAIALITVALVKVYINYSPFVFFLTMAGFVFGVTLIFGIIIFFMRRYSESMSFASFNREFLEKLPETDMLASSMRYLQYLTRKELYSMFVCLFGLFGVIHVYALMLSTVVFVGSFLVLILAVRFMPGMKRITR